MLYRGCIETRDPKDNLLKTFVIILILARTEWILGSLILKLSSEICQVLVLMPCSWASA